MTVLLQSRSRGRAMLGIALCVIIAMLGGYFTLDQVVRSKSAAAAASGFPFDTQAKVSGAEKSLTTAKPTPTKLRNAEQVARAALRDEPLNARALRLLGLVAAANGGDDRALGFFKLSERVSRRDLATQIVLLEAAVARGSVDQALEHYDRALRTNPTSSDLLFPVLTGALGDPVIRTGLVPYVHAKTPWMATFVNTAALQPSRVAAAADLLASAGAYNRTLIDEVGTSLLTRLVERGEYKRAGRILSLMGGSATIVRDARWTSESIDPRFSALAWTPIDTPEVSARFDQRGDPEMSLYAAPGQSGVVLSKLLNLPPGRYALVQESKIASRENDSALAWQMKCVGATDQLWKSPDLSTDQLHQGPGPVIGANCELQRLELVATGGTGQVGLDATLSNFRLVRR